MAHGTQVIDFIGSDLVDELSEVGGVGQVAIVEEEADLVMMTVAVEVLDTCCIE